MTRSDRVAGLILASGLSQRFAKGNKLLVKLDGDRVIRRTALAYTAAGLNPVLVVVGYQANLVEAAVRGLGILVVHNQEYGLGQSRSLVRGVAALPEAVAAAVIGVGDQPLLRAEVIKSLIATWRQTGAPLVIPRYAGRRGNPVLFARPLFDELGQVEGDIGGRPVIQRHLAEAAWVDVNEAALGLDVDSEDDLARVSAHLRGN